MPMIVEPIFEQHVVNEHPLVRPEGELLKLERKAFYTGAWMALGFFRRMNNMPDTQAVIFIKQLQDELRAVVYERPVTEARKKKFFEQGGV